MARYVDIEPLINQTEYEITKEANLRVKACSLAILCVLKDLPVADVVPVVRCKDCKHFQKIKGYANMCDKFSEAFFNSREENDYCSYGVRKDGEQNG